MAGEIDGESRLLVFAGGESRPPHGGLLYLDAGKGSILGRVPWRAEKYESVNAVSPNLLSGDRVFLTQCYGGGSAMLQAHGDRVEILWKQPEVGVHWMNPVEHEGHLYLCDGRHQQTSELVCLVMESGEVKWREEVSWQEEVDGRAFNFGIQRASLLRADGAFLCLGEMGSLLWMDLDPGGYKIRSRAQLFLAPQTWSLPVLHRGLLYVMQHGEDFRNPVKPRLLCYDLRGEDPGIAE